MSSNSTYDDARAGLIWNDSTKKLTVSFKGARCTRQNFYGPLPLSDVRDLVDRLKASPEKPLADVLKSWEEV